MALDREQLTLGLLARLETTRTTAGVVKLSRRMPQGDDLNRPLIQPEASPAVFFDLGDQRVREDGNSGGPRLWDVTFDVHTVVFDSSEDGPAARLNAVVDAIEACVEDDWTLGQMVQDVKLVSVTQDQDVEGVSCMWATLQFGAQVWG